MIQLRYFGLVSILIRIITAVMHLLVICKVLPYTWVSGGYITEYETAATTALASILILLISIAVYAIASGYCKIKLSRWSRVFLTVFLLASIPFDFIGTVMQFLGTDFERHVTSILALTTLLSDTGFAIMFLKKDKHDNTAVIEKQNN